MIANTIFLDVSKQNIIPKGKSLYNLRVALLLLRTPMYQNNCQNKANKLQNNGKKLDRKNINGHRRGTCLNTHLPKHLLLCHRHLARHLLCELTSRASLPRMSTQASIRSAFDNTIYNHILKSHPCVSKTFYLNEQQKFLPIKRDN